MSPANGLAAWQKMRLNRAQDLVIGAYTPGPRGFDELILRAF